MAVSATVLDLLLGECARRPFAGRLLSLGRQDVWLPRAEILAAASAKGVHLDETVGETLSNKHDLAQRACISDDCLFDMLGFAHFTSLDSSPYEGADLVFDLNSPDVPESLRGACDVILDIGVLEHVFDIAQAMENIHTMLAVGGRFVAVNPTVHTIDAAFYSLSPAFFHDFYTANAYDINTIKVYSFPAGHYHNSAPARMIEYQPGMLDAIGVGIDGCYWDVFSVATKTPASTGRMKPVQRSYAEQWELASLGMDLVRLLKGNRALRWKLIRSLEDDERRELAHCLSIADPLYPETACRGEAPCISVGCDEKDAEAPTRTGNGDAAGRRTVRSLLTRLRRAVVRARGQRAA